MKCLVIGRGEIAQALGEFDWHVCSYEDVMADQRKLSQFDMVFGCFSGYLKGRKSHAHFASLMSREQRYVYPSSRVVYEPDFNLVETSPLVEANDAYSITKLKDESQLVNLPRCIIVRLPNVLSASVDFEQKKFFSRFAANALRFKRVFIDGNKDSIKDFVCVEDVSLGIRALVENSASGVFNLGYGNGGITMGNFVEVASLSLGNLSILYKNHKMEEFSLNTDKFKFTTRLFEFGSYLRPSLEKIYWKLLRDRA